MSCKHFLFIMNINLEGGKMPIVTGDELLEAQAHIWKHIFSFINSMSLKCAVQLGIPDAIHRHGPHPMPLSQLVSALQLHPNKTRFIYRLMRLLAHSNFFRVIENSEKEEEEEEEEGYMLTNSSHLLLKDNPLSIAPYLLSMLDQFLMEPWQHLSSWVQSDDETSFHTAHGIPFWEYMGNQPKHNDDFNASMASDSRLVMTVLMEKYKGVFDGLKSLVDVGGGTGIVAKTIAEAFPETECVVFDLPQVVADLKGGRNFKFVAGDIFEAIPPADALLLKHILHDWSDEECVKILKNCKSAITKNNNKGKVIVIEMVVDSEKKDSIEMQLVFDMVLMTLTTGIEREEKEWAQLIKEAGFSSYKIFPILGLRSLIEIYP